MANTEKKDEVRMWPSVEVAARLYDVANVALILSLVVGVIATGLLVWMGNVKEAHLRLAIANANADAAHAVLQTTVLEKETAQARLETEKIKAQLAPRSLNVDQQSKLSQAVSPLKGTSLDILIYGGGSDDALPLAGMIGQTLTAAGWKVRIWNTIAPGRWVKGVLVTTKNGALESDLVAAVTLANALKNQGLAIGISEQFDPAQLPDNLNGPQWEQDKVAPIRIMVGSKP